MSIIIKVMKEDLINFEEIPQRLCNNCFKNSKLCLICQKNHEEYKKNLFSIWEELPENCNFSGYVFLKREYVKHIVRLKKEKILSLNEKIRNTDGIKQKRISKDIEKAQKYINNYEKYGSKNW